MNDGDGWEEWRKYILLELKRLNTAYESLQNNVNKISQEIAALKVKSGVWGLIGGLIPVIIMLVIYLLTRKPGL